MRKSTSRRLFVRPTGHTELYKPGLQFPLPATYFYRNLQAASSKQRDVAFIASKAEMAAHCSTVAHSAGTFGYGLLVIVHAERHALLLHLFHFKASENLLEVPHDVKEGRTQLRVHLREMK